MDSEYADYDTARIGADNIGQWAERLDATEDQLRAAIAHVGPKADDVIRYLGNPDVL